MAKEIKTKEKAIGKKPKDSTGKFIVLFNKTNLILEILLFICYNFICDIGEINCGRVKE